MWQPQADKYYEVKPSRVAKYRIKFEGARQLADVPGYVWFTPAALYLWGRFTELQLGDLVESTALRIFWYRFDRPLFAGFEVGGDKDWNHTLWAVEAESWEKLVDRMLELMLLDRPSKSVYRYALQQLSIADPLVVDSAVISSTTPPRTVVYAFAVNSDRHQLAFTQLQWDVSQLPGMRRLPASQADQNLAKRLFAAGVPTVEQAFDLAKRAQYDLDQKTFTELRKNVK